MDISAYNSVLLSAMFRCTCKVKLSLCISYSVLQFSNTVIVRFEVSSFDFCTSSAPLYLFARR